MFLLSGLNYLMYLMQIYSYGSSFKVIIITGGIVVAVEPAAGAQVLVYRLVETYSSMGLSQVSRSR